MTRQVGWSLIIALTSVVLIGVISAGYYGPFRVALTLSLYEKSGVSNNGRS